jgi:hypothetical protein
MPRSADDALDSTTAGRVHIDDSVALPQLVSISAKADPIVQFGVVSMPSLTEQLGYRSPGSVNLSPVRDV